MKPPTCGACAAEKLSAAAGFLLGAAVLAPAGAHAHFFLEEPENWREQGALGDPQKTGPCGDEGTAAATGAITAYQSGQTITIRFRETIFHPGHFRVALATSDRSELPPPPPVTEGRTDCGSVPIMDPPVFPVLADGVLPHTSPLTGVQSFDVTLPDGVTCDHCTLQIVQWMSEHSAPCFYYHCADLSISEVTVDAGPPPDDASVSAPDASSETSDAAGPSADTGATPRLDAGSAPPTPSSSCGCAVPGGDPAAHRSLSALALAALSALALRRRR